MHRRRAPRFLAVLSLFALLMSPDGHAVSRITLVAPAESGIYGEFAQSFQQKFEALCSLRRGLPICAQARWLEFRTLGALEPGGSGAADELVIALGSEASESLVRSGGQGSRLLTLIPPIAFDRLADCCLEPGNGAVSAVFVGQPAATQLRLIRALFPDSRRIGVLLGPASGQDAEDLLRLGKSIGLELAIKPVGNTSELGPALGTLLPEIDVLLAIPDPLVASSANTAGILLAAHRHRVPVIGYSEAMVRAGAAAAAFPEIDHLAEAAAVKVLGFCENRAMPPPGFALDYAVRVNRDVLRSLGLHAVSEQELRRTLTGVDP